MLKQPLGSKRRTAMRSQQPEREKCEGGRKIVQLSMSVSPYIFTSSCYYGCKDDPPGVIINMVRVG